MIALFSQHTRVRKSPLSSGLNDALNERNITCPNVSETIVARFDRDMSIGVELTYSRTIRDYQNQLLKAVIETSPSLT
jgi:hypothetical protein